MPEKTNSGNDLVNDPGTTGAYGLVRTVVIPEEIGEGVFIEKASGELVNDHDFTMMVLTRGIVVFRGAVKEESGRHKMFMVLALPRRFLRGFEDYVIEWVDKLPDRPYSMESGTRPVIIRNPDGSYTFWLEDEE